MTVFLEAQWRNGCMKAYFTRCLASSSHRIEGLRSFVFIIITFLFVSSFILTLLTENNPQEISSFSLTQPLIFVHGRVCIRRTAWISMLISKHCSLIVLWVGDLCVSPLKCQILFLKKNMATPISVHALSTSSSWTKHKTSSDLCV